MAKPKPQTMTVVKKDTIRCPCGIRKQSDERTVIQCNTCSVWQHNICVGFPEAEADLPPQYFCEKCQPQDHPMLMEHWHTGKLKRMRDLVRLRNARGSFEPSTPDEIADKEAWLVTECEMLVDRVRLVENYWHVYLTSESPPVEDEAAAAMKVEVLLVVKAVVLRLRLADVEAFRTRMVKCLRESPVLQVEVIRGLREKITKKMLASWEEEDEGENTETLTRRYFDLPG